MVKSLKDDSWEEVISLSNTVVSSCPQYGSPLYFHSPSEEEFTQKRQAEAETKETSWDDEYECDL